MVRSARLAIALLALLALTAAPAFAQAPPVLHAQIAQATPEPTATAEDAPPLTDEPPAGEEDDGTGDDGSGSPTSGSDLANTGAEPGLLALMGLGLLAAGLGLRRLNPTP